MPGVYREKTCPTCNVKHRRRGEHCSQSCANTGREATEKMRQNMRKVSYEYGLTPEGIAQKKMINSISSEEFAVDIPDIPPDIADIDMFNEYERGEKW